ncbi:phosphotransferase [Ferrimonas lipolytica]|uniref:Phosphotransferase n=1 Tax=Ferrimonas lipolytica TaxID=2724191 RepID=A0A6H1UAQ3_9GAMM|nr:phosphotransferase [Ferrimonas lipolytica]QIZ76131.1 phosphotransferase [Ferrimonas lipolytica]
MTVNLTQPKMMWHQAMPHIPLQHIEPLNGATVNQLFLVTADGRQWVLRLHAAAAVVDRIQEREQWYLAAAAGLAPELHYWSADNGFCISELGGSNPNKLESAPLLRLLNRLHQLAPITPPISYCDQIERYLSGVSSAPLAQWLALQQQWQQQLYRSELAPCFCHHDLHAGNILERQQHYLAIDFEYASFGHPLFDVAVARAQLPIEQQQQFVVEYYALRQLPYTANEQRALRAATALWHLTNCAWSLAQLHQVGTHSDTVAINKWCKNSKDWLSLNMVS